MSEYDDAYVLSTAMSPAALAERYVLGAILTDPRVLRDVQTEVLPRDFEDMRLGAIYAGLCRMAAEREPIDLLTVADHLADWDVRGIDLGQLAGWARDVPTATNAGYYARMIREKSLSRSLDVVAGKLRGAAEPTLALADAITELKDLRDRDASSTAKVRMLADVLNVPEQEDAYDWVIPDVLERRDRLMLTGSEGGGKALALDTPLPTPTGWTTMGDVAVGDLVLGADGRPTRVVAATDVMVGRPCYRVNFSDGSSIVADAEHQWLTDDYDSRQGTKQTPAVRTTEQIAATVSARGGFCLNHSVAPTEPLALRSVDLPLDPYVLGAWLGDGHTADGRITIGDEDAPEMLHLIAEAGWIPRRQSGPYLYGIPGLRVVLREAGVLGAKHIPGAYLRASFRQRLALLQGLMDTDGTVDAKAGVGRGSGSPRCEFSVVDERLARDVHELILSLGIVATFRSDPAKLNGRVVGTRYRIAFRTELEVFRLRRKLDRLGPLRTQRSRRRFIESVVRVASVAVKCIQVDNADHLYLAGSAMIPTHNSTMLRQLAVLSAAGVHPFRFSPVDPVRVLVVDAENSERQWRRAVRGMADRAAQVGVRDPRHQVALECTPRIDITRDVNDIHRRIDEVRPDLLLIGPLYRLTPRAIKDDDDAAPVLAALDSLRDRDVAMLIEAHAGHASSATGERDLRPRGSSALLGWPEFGLGLRRDKQVDAGGRVKFSLVRWRGDRDQRQLPGKFARGDYWPWEPSLSVRGMG